ncbi:hypothetical protein [Salipiger sp. PrR003]|uniref:hypothetical protein n=1 Tax=Salipiger sp. PrR003 TaxID=2706776 RepID=UPI0013DBA373|nr:hypothetical protein [Salipiger sp. PrR003]NDV51557.1 hypothetical protein [Salipiger sp. PrR003]
MAKKTKARDLVRVKMTGDHTYKLDASSKRTLPAGWSGPVPAAVADEIEKEKKGARVGADAADKTETDAVKKAAAKAAAPAKPAAAKTNPATAGATDPAPASSGANEVSAASTGASAADTGAAD